MAFSSWSIWVVDVDGSFVFGSGEMDSLIFGRTLRRVAAATLAALIVGGMTLNAPRFPACGSTAQHQGRVYIYACHQWDAMGRKER